MKFSFARFALFSLCFVVLFAFAASAQDLDDVTISGLISDSNKLPIVGATVVATEVISGTERTVTTNDEGRYKFIELKPGTYKVRASAKGFGAKERIDIVTLSGQNLQLDLTLNPADVQAEATVTVTDEDAPVVDTSRTIVGGTISEKEIEEVPNTTRNPLDLVFLLGGVTEEPLSARDIAEDRASGSVNQSRAPLEAGIFALSGGAAYSNNLTIDGFDNNDDRLAQDRFQLPYDSVAEVQVVTNQFSSEYGRASGGRVNQRTRSGGKKFHGGAYLFFKDDNLNANTFNNNRRNLARLPMTEYNPGGTVSGPIPWGYFKNRTFFFTSYEYVDTQDTALIDTIVPTTQNPFFDLPTPTGQGITRPETASPPSGLAPAMLAPYIKPVDTPSRSHRYLARGDHRFSENNDITFSYQLGRLRNARQYRTPTNTLDDALQSTIRDTNAVNFTHNYVFNAQMVNQARFQFSNYTPNFGSDNPTDPVFLITLRDNSPLVPTVDRRNGTLVAGNSTAAANGNFSSVRAEKRYQIADTFTQIAGNHSIRYGGDIQPIRSKYFALGDATGTYNFDSVADFIANRVVRLRKNFGTDSITKNTYMGFFVQDDWKLASNFTFNFGLRYERETIIKDNNNWGPRIAFAWDPFKKGKGVIRAGAGIFYNRALLRTIDDFTINQTNFDSRLIPGPATDVTCYSVPANASQPRCQFLFSLGVDKPVPTLEDLQNSTITGVSTAFTNAANNFDRRLDPNLHIPESYQFNVGFERELTKAIVFEANLTFNRTIGLWREFNVNTFNLPSGFTDYNDYLVRGNTNTTLKFVNGDPNDTTSGVSAVVNGVRTVNLANRNTSTAAATSPMGLARGALAAQLGRRISNTLTDVEQVGSYGRTQYQGLILEVRRGYRQLGGGFGMSFRAVYTLSRLKDDGIVNTSNAQFSGDFESEFARSILDRRHRFVVSGIFEVPKWFGKLRFSPVVRLYSGAPFNLGNGGNDRNLDDVSNDRPNFSGDVSDIRVRSFSDPLPTDLFAQFTPALIGTHGGNLPRNAGHGPSQFLFDLNLSREFKFGEGMSLRPNVEFDNILNHTAFTYGSDFINFSSTVAPADFLVPERTLRPRQIRVGMRFRF